MGSINRQYGDTYRQVANYGHSPEFKAFMDSHPIPAGRGSLVGRCILEGKVVQIPDVQADPDYTFGESTKIGGIRTMIGVPLLRDGTPIGVAVLQRRAVQPFTDKQIDLITTFADQAVIAIKNVRLFEAEQQRTRELTGRWAADGNRGGAAGHLELARRADRCSGHAGNAAHICEAKFSDVLYEGMSFARRNAQRPARLG
jgi:GAF domain-containing protein